MSIAKHLVVFGLIAASLSCSSLGTKVKVIQPEAAASMRTVAIWPFSAVPMVGQFAQKYSGFMADWLQNDPTYRANCEEMNRQADFLLYKELSAGQLFTLVSPDSVMDLIARVDTGYWRFSEADWQTYREVIHTDGVLVPLAHFEREGGGQNSYVSLTLYDCITGEQIVVATFNTKWGKSYMFEKQLDVTFPDAIHGAAAGLIKALRERPALGAGR